MTIRPKTRDELLKQLSQQWHVRKDVAGERLDAVLVVVLELMREQRLDYDFSAVPVFDQLLRWKGERR